MLKLDHVSKTYNGQRGVQNLDFSMERGEIVGFLGPNGAGKTTTMRMITGYLRPTEGKILLDGMSVHEQGRKVRSRIGYLPETPPLYPDMSVLSYLKFVAKLRDVPAREQKKRVDEMVSRLGLIGREHQMIRSLSKGYKQRTGLAGAIIHKPDLLILDEPTSGLDPNQIMEIRDLIKELGENHTVLLSTHILPEVSTLCNRVLIINQGELVLDGAPASIGSSMENSFQVQVTVKGEADHVLPILTSWGNTQEHPISLGLQNESDGTLKLEFTTPSRYDYREALFNKLASENIPILEMKKQDQSLEEVFQKLTMSEKESSVELPKEVVALDSTDAKSPEALEEGSEQK
ncbi:ATP-binding cassette domain-containing protein [Paenibacillus sp. Marseille-Q4541]|uniref:ABC transporter ATP-binding protein n=1 Tax=Paenibacillus sp. Marseille-Q4541 TaxID=2831522 RepID=UPI001BA5A0A8|nr:ATP-binding cassette domain-containing protein [Paenibacillus sp. Marseille-Q4541]